MLSLIDVACGAFGGLLLIALVLIRVAPPSAPSRPSGLITLRLPIQPMSAQNHYSLYKEEIRIDGMELINTQTDAPNQNNPRSGWTKAWNSIGWCDRFAVDLQFMEGAEPERVLRLAIEGLRRPVTISYQVTTAGPWSRKLPSEGELSVAGTIFNNRLRADLEAKNRRVGLAGDTVRIRVDPAVRTVARFVRGGP